MVEGYDEGYGWRYVVRSAHGRNAGANLDRRREVWRYRRTLPVDLRGRAGQVDQFTVSALSAPSSTLIRA